MALPRYFVPRAGAVPQMRSPAAVAYPLDVSLIQGAGSPPEEWLVGLDQAGMLTVQRTEPADQLLPSVRDALALHEVSGGAARVLAVESLHLFELYGLDRTPDVPGLDDPVRLYGAVVGPLAPGSTALQRMEGQLMVTRGELLEATIAGRKDAFLHFDPVTDQTARTLHMWLPGDQLPKLALGRGAVLAYCVLGEDITTVGPGNEALVTEVLHDVVSAVCADISREGRTAWLDPEELPVPDRARLEQHLVTAGYTIDRDRDRARRGGRLFSLLGGERRKLPIQGSFNEFMRLAQEALERFPSWPSPRVRELFARVRREARFSVSVPTPPAPVPVRAPVPVPPPAPRAARTTDWISRFVDQYDEADRRTSLWTELAPAPAALSHPFASVTVEGCDVVAKLRDDIVRRKVDVALYLDGAARAPWANAKQASRINTMVRTMVESLAQKDADGRLRTAYWSCGPRSDDVELVGDLGLANVGGHVLCGPSQRGSRSKLVSGLQDYVSHLQERPQPFPTGCAIFLSAGKIADASALCAYSAKLADHIALGELPRLRLILISISVRNDEHVSAVVSRANSGSILPLWRRRTAEEIELVPQLLTWLIDEAANASLAGTILDEDGRVLRSYERLPPILKFSVPAGSRAFVLSFDGKRYVQPIA